MKPGTLLLACLVFFSCSRRPDNTIVGTWSENGIHLTLEATQDGRVVLRNAQGGEGSSGRYRIFKADSDSAQFTIDFEGPKTEASNGIATVTRDSLELEFPPDPRFPNAPKASRTAVFRKATSAQTSPRRPL